MSIEKGVKNAGRSDQTVDDRAQNQRTETKAHQQDPGNQSLLAGEPFCHGGDHGVVAKAHAQSAQNAVADDHHRKHRRGIRALHAGNDKKPNKQHRRRQQHDELVF